MMTALLDRLGARSRPLYGVVVLWCSLICAAPLATYFICYWPGDLPHGQRLGPATVLSFLPDSVLLARWPQWLAGIGFAIGAILWLRHRLLPWSSWLTALSFTSIVALYIENATQLTHVAHLTNVMLLLYAFWYHACAKDIDDALRRRALWQTPLYPRWVYLGGVFAVGYFYGISGLMKWLTSGPGWANGVSMQIWVQLFGHRQSFASQLVLTDRNFATALQWGALIGETAGFLAIVSRSLRPWIGLLLISFHIGQIAIFGWGFHANMVLIALVFLPFEEWIDVWRRRFAGASRSGSEIKTQSQKGASTDLGILVLTPERGSQPLAGG